MDTTSAGHAGSRAPLRTAGLGLLAYGLGTAVAFLASGSPGGDYRPSGVADYVSSGHFLAAATLWYVGALAALGLVVVSVGLRDLPGTGALVSRLALVGASVSVVGAFVAGGVTVAAAEGGSTVRSGVPGPVVYTFTEIGGLLAVCAPALCFGVAALVLAARSPLPAWLRAFSGLAGVCGILAPLFFTFFVWVLWTVVAGAVLAAGRTGERVAAVRPSLV